MEIAPDKKHGRCDHPHKSLRFMESIGAERKGFGHYAAGLRTGVMFHASLWQIWRTAAGVMRARYPPSASNNALASWSSAVSKPSVNQP